MGIPSTTITSIDELQREILEPVIGLSVVVARVQSREENAGMLLELYQGIESI